MRSGSPFSIGLLPKIIAVAILQGANLRHGLGVHYPYALVPVGGRQGIHQRDKFVRVDG